MINGSGKRSGRKASSSASKKSSLKSTIKDQSGAGKVKIGEILSKEGQITSLQLKAVIDYQKVNGGRLSSILVNHGYIDDRTIVNVLVRRYNYESVNPEDQNPAPEIFELIPYETAKKYMVFPLRLKEDLLEVAMVEPTDTIEVEKLQTELNRSIHVYVSTEKEIVNAFRTHYKIEDTEYNSYFDLKGEEVEEDLPVTSVDDFGSLVSEAAEELELASPDEDAGFDEYAASDAPIIKLVNGILTKAIADGVSDIHIEPFEKTLQVRYRLDGSLYKSMNLPLSIKNALISRIKILSQLNIAERRVPQDGRIKMRVGLTKSVDFRVSTLPTLFGEGVVMRILDKGALNVDLTKMGFEVETYAAVQRCTSRPYGLLLVTGPTGSGKTTTLYSILNKLNKEDTKILTAEDPVEFNFKGINQVLVREEVGMTFAAALKAFLRQDPDIIMVGEIRDLDTAEIAIKAAMTGHLVFSTLHTNDSPSTIGRLIDIGIPAYMLASSVTMVLSQRLARQLCPHCKVRDYSHDPGDLLAMGFTEAEIPELELYTNKGCPKCNGSGFKGRTGLFELMEVTEEVGKAINANVPEDQLRKTAVNEGMMTLRDAALQKARNGFISVGEVLKRTTITKEALPAYLLNPDREEYENGDIVIREGNKDKDFFQLIRGAVSIKKGGSNIALITEPGEYFGEMSAITGEPRSASVVSNGRSVVTRFPGDKLPETIEKYPKIASRLFSTFAKRLAESDTEMVNMNKKILASGDGQMSDDSKNEMATLKQELNKYKAYIRKLQAFKKGS